MSSGGARKGKKVIEEEHENHERWLVSYADMMTVLVALFIVLYAISQVDEAKFDQLRTSLAAGFGAPQVSILSDGSGPMAETSTDVVIPTIEDIIPTISDSIQESEVSAVTGSADAIDAGDLAVARLEYSSFEDLAAQIEAALTAKGLQGVLEFKIDERGLVIGMVTNEVFFAAESAVLTQTSQIVIDTMSPFVVGLPNEISIEGHANTEPTTVYSSNWELSSDRATQVLRRMVEVGGVPGNRVASVGYGEARPLVPNDTPEGLASNRRVDLVVLSDKPERIRALLPLVPTLQEG
ncbi:OmpA/MotB family protein [Sanguibacter antarcticus]|uniref:Chemotaxis protein MotB n=1 Tax=Sanguibacter antarcticus TaxID=372484 RepID=A0A2A9E206_9MICO|nr:flagellar motor protein MotB [Sanguibacter antarcticus]PFG32242.1 chemotaxis protein MotB [Sanguibacter antarcticus]